MEKIHINEVSTDMDIASVSVIGTSSVPFMEFKIFSALAKADVRIDLIMQSVILDSDITDVSFTVKRIDLDKSMELLEREQSVIGFDYIRYNDDLAKLSIVGAGMAIDSGIAATVFEVLSDCGVDIHMIFTSEVKILLGTKQVKFQ
jgi:aspartate kinase